MVRHARTHLTLLAILVCPGACLRAARPAAPPTTEVERAAYAGAPGPSVLWERFVSELRRGDYRRAYACFSPESRKVFSFRQFSEYFNPLGAMYEATMSPLDNGRVRIQGCLAHLSYLAASGKTADGRARHTIRVTALMTREQGRWLLVASVREPQARLEAEAKQALRLLWRQPAVSAARAAGRVIDARALAASPVLRGPGGLVLRSRYRFAMERSEGRTLLTARPQVAGLRAFMLLAGKTGEEPRLRVIAPHPAGIASMAGESGTGRKTRVSNLPVLPPPPPDMGDPEDARQARAPSAPRHAPRLPPAPSVKNATARGPLAGFDLPELPAMPIAPTPACATKGCDKSVTGQTPVSAPGAGVPERQRRKAQDDQERSAASSPSASSATDTPRKLLIRLPPLPPPDRGDPADTPAPPPAIEEKRP